MTQHNHAQFQMTPGVYDPSRRTEIQAFIPGPDEHYALPENVTKAQAISVAAQALRLQGVPAGQVLVLQILANQTERAAWHSTTSAPINWRRQCDIAREAGITPRHLRRVEASLTERGVLARSTAENGYRGYLSRRAHTPSTCGLSLEPLIANYAGFLTVVTEARALNNAHDETMGHIRQARRRLRALTEAIADMETRRWADQTSAALWGALPAERLRKMDLAQLVEHHAALLDLEDRIRSALTPLPLPPAGAGGDNEGNVAEAHDNDPAQPQGQDRPAALPDGSNGEDGESAAPETGQADDSAPLPPPAAEPVDAPVAEREAADPVGNSTGEVLHRTPESGGADMGVRCHIQPEDNLYNSCNPAGEEDCSDPDPMAATEGQAGKGVEKDGERCSGGAPQEKMILHPAVAQKMTKAGLRALASDDLALYLDAVESWSEIIPYVLRELDIHPSAWGEACHVMGAALAFLSLVVIDRNRFHPHNPVVSPGGALRAFTARARSGELDLTRAVIGIWERERQGKQPKGGLTPVVMM